MQDHVLVVVPLLGEPLPSDRALVWLLTSVDPDMVQEVPSFVELPPTAVIVSLEVPQDPASCLVVLVQGGVLVLLQRGDIGFFYIVISKTVNWVNLLRRGGQPFLITIIIS